MTVRELMGLLSTMPEDLVVLVDVNEEGDKHRLMPDGVTTSEMDNDERTPYVLILAEPHAVDAEDEEDES